MVNFWVRSKNELRVISQHWTIDQLAAIQYFTFSEPLSRKLEILTWKWCSLWTAAANNNGPKQWLISFYDLYLK